MQGTTSTSTCPSIKERIATLPLDDVVLLKDLDLGFTQKVFNLQVVQHSALRHNNIVLICQQDFATLFGSTPSKQPNYLQVANDIYRVMIGSLKHGWMAVTDLHREKM